MHIHIALDTGMSRIGFADRQESVEEIKKISQLPNLKIEGMFTHFARADEIRDELLAKGIILKDTREGVKWKRA